VLDQDPQLDNAQQGLLLAAGTGELARLEGAWEWDTQDALRELYEQLRREVAAGERLIQRDDPAEVVHRYVVETEGIVAIGRRADEDSAAALHTNRSTAERVRHRFVEEDLEAALSE
jgi:hypothetical protein